MTKRMVGYAALLATLTLAVASIVAGSMLPAEMQLPIHWGLSGEADGFAGKWVALLTPPAMVAAISLLFHFLPAIEPRKDFDPAARQHRTRGQSMIDGKAAYQIIDVVVRKACEPVRLIIEGAVIRGHHRFFIVPH